MYTLMAEAELRRFPFFRRLGVVGIDGSAPPSVVRALHLLESRLQEHPDSVVVFFPQGRIWPSHRRPLGFCRGVELFARQLSTIVLPVGLHAEPLNTISPSFFVAVGEPLDGAWRVAELERRVEAQLDAIHAFLSAYGEDAPRVWPGPHAPLPAAGELLRETP
jgi:hypothetical protein